MLCTRQMYFKLKTESYTEKIKESIIYLKNDSTKIYTSSCPCIVLSCNGSHAFDKNPACIFIA